jgi:hypothetical protein
MASERQTRSLSKGCPLMGRKSAWAAARAEVIALGVMVAGRGNQGGLPCLKTRNVYQRGKTHRDRYFSKLWSTHILGAKAIALRVSRVSRVLLKTGGEQKLVVWSWSDACIIA